MSLIRWGPVLGKRGHVSGTAHTFLEGGITGAAPRPSGSAKIIQTHRLYSTQERNPTEVGVGVCRQFQIIDHEAVS